MQRLRVVLLAGSRAMQDALLTVFRTIPEARVAGAAPTGPDVLDWLSGNPNEWDLAVVDIAVPRMEGLCLIAPLKTRRTATCVVAVTDAGPAIQDLCVGLGADAVFEKIDAFHFYQYVTRFASARVAS